MAPRLLDLFCGAGGAAAGYTAAGFEVTGVDIVPQRHFPYEFVEADAMKYLAEGHWKGFDAIHASPPCQGYSVMRNLPWLREREYPLLIKPIRDLLRQTGLPYIIENVMGAAWYHRRMSRPETQGHDMMADWLCGMMFNRSFYRHRLFETSWLWFAPEHPRHLGIIRKGRLLGTRARKVAFAGYGHSAGIALVREAMGIDWMTRDEITQAVPPCYTRYLGEDLMTCFSA